MTWQVVELAQRGKVQHWRHGWIPITPEAKAIVAERQKKAAARLKAKQVRGGSPAAAPKKGKYDHVKWVDDLSPEDRQRLPNDLKFPLPHMRDSGPRQWAPQAIQELKRQDALAVPKTEALKPAAMVKPAIDPKKLTAEWKSATRSRPRTAAEEDAVHNWQNGYMVLGNDEEFDGAETGMYQLLNDTLRGSGQHDLSLVDAEGLDELDTMNDHLTAALAKSKTTRDVTVYRGVSGLGQVEVGDVLTDPGWQATSLNPDVANDFLGGGIAGAKGTGDSRIMVITIPKGKNALAVREKDQFEKLTGMKHEIVLGPGSPLRVVKTEGNRVYLEMQ